MQPYFFPYIGYFQLICSSDAFVIFDDVNFIKKGWINRNRILSAGEPKLITLELIGASQNKLIKQLSIGNNNKKLLKSIQYNYAKAPYFKTVYPLIEEILSFPESNLAKYLENSLKKVCDYLQIETNWYISSTLDKQNTLTGENRILNICEVMNAKHYINLPGGRNLYNTSSFKNSGIELSFINMHTYPYSQFDKPFVGGLSIIDIMMFNDREQCNKMANQFSLDEA